MTESSRNDRTTTRVSCRGEGTAGPGEPLTAERYVEEIRRGNRVVLGQAITLIESTRPEHTELALQIIERCMPYTGRSLRIGVTGAPGVGKSTFIDAFGTYLTRDVGRRVAVLTVDPTSQRTGGSILGDKTRMQRLSTDPMAFIRPSPSGGSLGGVARKTRETVLLCEAAGYDTIIVETVGVGQSESTVRSLVDFFLLLVLAGAGDELQGIKRGVMELADAIAITKADGPNKPRAEQARRIYANALSLFPPTESGWKPTVLTCSAVTGDGIEEIWSTVLRYHEHVSRSSHLEKMRKDQRTSWLRETIEAELTESFYGDPEIRRELAVVERKVREGRLSPFSGARELLELYWSRKGRR